jgi:D-sedoheptulose 7-phosphate isomerase
MDRIIRKYLNESIKVKRKILDDPYLLDKIKETASLIIEAYGNRKKLILFGNGGSAADAQHIAAELVNKFTLERSALPALAFTTDTSILTSIANDYDYARVFARQVEALVEEGDVVIGLSTSGSSLNVLKGLEGAKEKGARTIGFTGKDGGKLTQIADLILEVPSSETPRIQEAHITILHIICFLIERKLFGEKI